MMPQPQPVDSHGAIDFNVHLACLVILQPPLTALRMQPCQGAQIHQRVLRCCMWQLAGQLTLVSFCMLTSERIVDWNYDLPGNSRNEIALYQRMIVVLRMVNSVKLVLQPGLVFVET